MVNVSFAEKRSSGSFDKAKFVSLRNLIYQVVAILFE